MKKYIAWSEELSVGIQEIDEQHKVLVNLINCLYEKAVLEQADSSTVHAILNEITQYTAMHLAVEESLLRLFHYPQTASHQEKHEELKEEVIKIQNHLHHHGAFTDIEFLKPLKNWLKQHILTEDKKFASFFLERGARRTWPHRTRIGRIWDSAYIA